MRELKAGVVPDDSNKPFPVKKHNKTKTNKQKTTYVLKFKIYLCDTTLKD